MRLPEAEARRRLAAARVARLATVSEQGQPHLVPVTFALDGDLIYTAVDAKPKTTRNLQRLRNLRANPRVAVLADHYAEDWAALWWVRADGTASVLDGTATAAVLDSAAPSALAAPLRALAARYPQYADSPPDGPVIVIRVDRWRGWSAS